MDNNANPNQNDNVLIFFKIINNDDSSKMKNEKDFIKDMLRGRQKI
jgi:hypothetical protein